MDAFFQLKKSLEEAKTSHECLVQHGADKVVIGASEFSDGFKCWMCPTTLVTGG